MGKLKTFDVRVTGPNIKGGHSLRVDAFNKDNAKKQAERVNGSLSGNLNKDARFHVVRTQKFRGRR